MITDKASKVIARMAFITDKDISYDHQGYIGKDIWLLKPGLFTIHHMIKDVTAKTSSIKGAIRRMTSGRGCGTSPLRVCPSIQSKSNSLRLDTLRIKPLKSRCVK